jgi:predicted nucleotidyltransferase component of viral defense system
MIPTLNIIAWGQKAPWPEQRQVEQDLIISRALVELFNDPFLRQQLRVRGGTALNKLHFPTALRYSEDIDLVRTVAGPIGEVLDHVRAALEPWLGRANFEQSEVAPKLRFRIAAEDKSSSAPLRLKVEIATREPEAYDPPTEFAFRVENPWFTGEASIPSFSREEILATKLRALLQRERGRDLLDLSHSEEVFAGLNDPRVVELFSIYMQIKGLNITRAEAERRMYAKLANPNFLADVRPLLTAAAAAKLNDEAARQAFDRVMKRFISQLPGAVWARSQEMRKRFGLPEEF